MKQNQRTVLIIDDSVEDRETYRRYLLQDANYTYRILEEEYGENGLELCKRVNPDAILLDYRLPDIDGLEFLSELKTQTGKTKFPVVMLTGYGNEAIAVAAMKSGAQDYLVKGGMTPENLRVAIRHAVEQAYLKRQLEESQERLRLFESIVVNANDAVLVTTTHIDDPGPRILYVNEAFTRMTGYTREEVLGQSPRFLQGTNTARATLDQIRTALAARQPVQVELINYCKDGSELWVELSITPVAKATGEYIHFIGIQRDITERKRTEEALRQSEQKYRFLTEATPQFVWIAQPNGQLDYCNQYWYDYSGLTQEQTLSSGWASVLHPGDRKRTLEQWNRAQEVGESYEIEYRVKRSTDGVYRWYLSRMTPIRNEQGQIVKWMGTAIDIHDRKQAEEQLRQSQHFIQQIADTTPNILYLYDLLKQRYIYVNRRITDVLGYSQTEICQMGTEVLQRLMHPEDLDRLPAYFNQFYSAEDGKILEFDYRMKGVDNEWHWFCSRDTVFSRMADGSPHQLLGTVEDITIRKHNEAERAQLLAREQAARAAAEKANRTKDEFLAMVSHELRNPLSAVLAYSQLLQTRQLNESMINRALETIERNAKLQAKLINDLLDISRITSGTLRLIKLPIDLAVVVEAAIDTMRLAAQAKAITIESALEPVWGYVLGDMERLQQVIGNLLANAIKFTPEGGTIQVQLQYFDEHVQVKVTDTGQGISAEFLPYVFDPFRQAEKTNTIGGLGLGLAIVRHLVELHGGTIQAESPGEGQGSTFTVELPFVEDDV
ncbi:MAG: PAS domain S-box protein [Coleofasciculus sp. Co-bin14]|nr:PAS domain S-box protein [Coleofasciculus sp. Co-bin14]